MASYAAVDVSDVALNTNTNVRSMQFYSTGKKTKLLTEQHLTASLYNWHIKMSVHSFIYKPTLCIFIFWLCIVELADPFDFFSIDYILLCVIL